MKINIKLLGPLIRDTGYENEFTIEAATPASALESLAGRYPALRNRLYEGGQLRPHLAFFLDDEVTAAEKLSEPASDGVELCVGVPVAGG